MGAGLAAATPRQQAAVAGLAVRVGAVALRGPAWGVNGQGPLPVGVEWAVRLPVAGLMMLATAVLADTVARAFSRRTGVLVALVLWTMPLTQMLARQVMTDAPFVSLFIMTLCFALRRAWLKASVTLALGVLAKGLMALLPLLIVPLAWACLVEPGESRRKAVLMRLAEVPKLAPVLAVGVAGPWLWVMSRFEGRDEEGRLFVERFFGYDHFERLFTGVHSTTPGGSFAYFIEQGAYAIAPWVGLLPVAAVTIGVVLKGDSQVARELVMVFGLASLCVFGLVSASATRFHHYVFPVLPGIAVVVGLTLDSLLRGVTPPRAALVGGGLLAGLVWKDLLQRPRALLDLFTYNHSRPYPDLVLSQPFPFRSTLMFFAGALLVCVALLVMRIRIQRVAALLASSALGLAVLLSWQHWPALGTHWTQRHLVDRYFELKQPGEPLIAFLMNWKGETLYTRNEVRQVTKSPSSELAALLAGPGRAFVVVEHERLPALAAQLPPRKHLSPVDLTSTNKFALVQVDDERR